jgi:hypothetical protein
VLYVYIKFVVASRCHPEWNNGIINCPTQLQFVGQFYKICSYDFYTFLHRETSELLCSSAVVRTDYSGSFTLNFQIPQSYVPRSAHYSALETEATHSSKAVVLCCHSTRYHSTEDNITYFQVFGYFYVFQCLILTFTHQFY